MKKPMIGVQLYGSTYLFRKDPGSWIRALAEAGYDALEPCVRVDGERHDFAWDPDELPRFASLAREAGLALPSCHLFTEDLVRTVPKCAELAEKYGFRSFVVGFSGEISRERLDAFARTTREAGKAFREAGLELWLHNNAPEIREKADGVSAYEYLLRSSDGFLGAQVDTGWVLCGGEDVMAFLGRNRDLVRSVHHKDIAAPAEDPVNVALGTGAVDPKGPYDFAAEGGLYQVVDQDNSREDFLRDLRDSLRILRGFSSAG